jgi:hypothetical protein
MAELVTSIQKAVDFLIDNGFRSNVATFHADVCRGLIGKGKSGKYSKKKLLAYGQKYCRTLTETAEIKEAKQKASEQKEEAQITKSNADAELKMATAERVRLKLQVEKGLLIEKEKMELSLSARMAFFKNELMTAGTIVADELIDNFGVDKDRKEDLFVWWESWFLKWLDAFSVDREFSIDLDIEEVTPGLLTGRFRGRPRKAAIEPGATK